MRRYNERKPFLTAREVKNVILAAKEGRDQALLTIIYQFGLRRSEVQYLRRQDWNSQASLNGSLVVWRVKTYKRDAENYKQLEPDEKPVWGRTKALLQAYLKTRDDDSGALFLGERGPMGPQAVYYVFRDAAKRAGLSKDKRNPHILRHSIATHQMNMGASLADIASWLGHKSLASTLHYTKVLTPRKEELIMRSEVSSAFAQF